MSDGHGPKFSGELRMQLPRVGIGQWRESAGRVTSMEGHPHHCVDIPMPLCDKYF